MNERQSKSFSGFLFSFMAIIAVAFGVLIWAGLQSPKELEQNIKPVDNIALPN
ncbi:MAG: hypothetical protein JWL87_518 [Candidatus Adlerbacteria bacterium]|nr:hypothetical protein [Candidatus Adlerbacteria bacterium]